MAEASRPVVSPAHASRVGVMWQSAVGKKALMAVSGVVLSLYVIGHLLGNLQMFAGPGQINRYAALLHVSPQFLWTVRVVLLAALLVHVAAGIQLHMAASAARPIGYEDYRPASSSAASRTMIWSGLLIFAFVIYHLLDLTVGVVNPAYVEGDVYHNVLATFGRGLGVALYLVSMVALAFHLWHGLWSMFSSLGYANRRAMPGIKRAAATIAVILAIGFAAIPVAVVVGLLKPAP
jgi:succinate dehydrogenase / fumarate reductase, cytochrome b subunit